jgi:hypothetical protein
MKILDMSAGNRAVWFDKDHRECIYVDIRESVKPTVVGDTRNLGNLLGEQFNLIVFDPPHHNYGANGNMTKIYGHYTTEEIRELITKSAKEAHRLSAPDALMAFKWNDHDQKLDSVLALMPDWEPLFGHSTSVRTKHNCQTYWVMLKRRPQSASCGSLPRG